LGVSAGHREPGEINRDEARGNRQAVAVAVDRAGEIFDQLIRAWLIDRLAVLDLYRSFLFSCALCLRASDWREDYHPEGEHNWEKRG
jgi:hypothetical protein